MLIKKTRMEQVAKDVHHISLMPRNSINCYIIEGVLVDAGVRSSYKKISKTLEKVPIHCHALTHAHADHQGSSDEICNQFNVPFFCHENEVHRAETGIVTKEYPSEGHLIARMQQKYWAGKGHKVDRILKENDWIGGFQVIETPGHSSGHISFFREKDGVLIIGDAATNMNLLTTIPELKLPPGLFTLSQTVNISSLVKLARLNPKTICFGHGPVLKNSKKEFERFVKTVSISANNNG
jgi:glyoxylase-like metal-dependent hydrolase (beta-lactamase superfamily II)